LLVSNGKDAGVSIGTPLADAEDRTHKHSLSGSFTFPVKQVAGAGGGNKDGAKSGKEPSGGFKVPNTGASPSGYPFVQLTACRYDAFSLEPAPVIPRGSLSLWDPAVSSAGCPAPNSTPLTAGAGRLLAVTEVPGSAPVGQGVLLPKQDVTHSHSYSASVVLKNINYAGIHGCCNKNPTAAGPVTYKGVSSEASTNLPYSSVLACESTEPDELTPQLPPGAVLMTRTGSCPVGWVPIRSALAGRLVVGTPANGAAAVPFGGSRIPDLGSGWTPTHTHSYSISFDPEVASVALAVQKNKGSYGMKSKLTAKGNLNSDPSHELPVFLVQGCVQANELPS